MKKTLPIALACVLVCALAVVLCACGRQAVQHTASSLYVSPSPAAAEAEPTPAAPEQMESVAAKASLDGGLMLIQLPDDAEDAWYEVQNDDACVTLSDGANAIVMNHYPAGSEPAAATADGVHAMVYQTSFAHDDLVVVLTGYIQDEEDYSMVRQMMDSVDIDWEMLAGEEVPAQPDHDADANLYTMADTDYTAWVSCSCLNVREEGSADAVLIAQLSYGTKVSVNAIVQKNGQNTGWVRITCGNITGYVCAQYLADTQPSATPAPTATAAPTATPSPTAAPTVLRYMYVANVPYCCNLWATSKGQTVVTTIPVNTCVGVIEQTSSSFYKVTYNGYTGWVNTAYLSAAAPAAPATPTPVPEPDWDVDPSAPDTVIVGSYDAQGYVADTFILYLTKTGMYMDGEGWYYTAAQNYTVYVRQDTGTRYYVYFDPEPDTPDDPVMPAATPVPIAAATDTPVPATDTPAPTAVPATDTPAPTAAPAPADVTPAPAAAPETVWATDDDGNYYFLTLNELGWYMDDGGGMYYPNSDYTVFTEVVTGVILTQAERET